MKKWNLILALVVFALATACGSDDKPDLDKDGWTESFTNPNNDAPDRDPDPDPDPIVPDPDPDLLPNGAPCSVDTECNGGTCFTGPEFQDGFCTEVNCGRACITPGECVDSALGNFCAPACTDDDECRDGYVCGQVAGANTAVCTPIFGLPDGEACTVDNDCQGGTCITDWPDGYCTTLQCTNFEDCARQGNDNRCLQNPQGPNLCVRICQDDSECRQGYLCENLGGGEGLCSPDPSMPIDPTVLAGLPFDTTCVQDPNGSISYDFTIAPQTTSYQITPINLDGSSLNPLSIDLVNGTSVNFGGANRFQAINASFYAMNPTVIPGTPDFTAQLLPGTHTYRLSSQSTETCFYQVEETSPGTQIDLNVYFVGIGGLTSVTANQHADFQAALVRFDEIYATAGFTRGVTRYFDITGNDEAAYSVLRSEQDILELVALSTQPGATRDEVLSVNVFFVRAFALGGAIGVSEGLPGPAGLHGTQASGVAFTSEFLGEMPIDRFGNPVDGNNLTAQVLAHEIGHYLGLFHTTEADGVTHDPLGDTPECDGFGLGCPDINNLMFPTAGEDHIEITPDQIFVFGANPLTKEMP